MNALAWIGDGLVSMLLVVVRRRLALQRVAAAGAIGLVALGGQASAQVIYAPIATTGHDQDIIYEIGLAAGAVGATGELGSRQFYEEGISTQTAAHKPGLTRSITGIESTLTDSTFNFNFRPFEENNILKFNSADQAKSLTLVSPDRYSHLAVVLSGGSMATATEYGILDYTINYAGGSTQTGSVNVGDWGAIPATLTVPGTEVLVNAGRTGNTTPPVWPVTPEGETTAGRWSLYVTEIMLSNPGLNVLSVEFSNFQLATVANNEITMVGNPNSGDDIVVFGLSGGVSGVPGDVNDDEVADILDFNIIRDNFQQAGNRAMGDLNGTGFVDLNDFRQWKNAAYSGGAGTSLGAAIPEPSSGLLCLAALALLAGWRRFAGRTR